MKAKDIKKMLFSGKHDHKTVAEFAQEVKNHKKKTEEFDIEKWAEETNKIFEDMVDDIAFLTDPNWTPTKVTHYTNRKDK